MVYMLTAYMDPMGYIMLYNDLQCDTVGIFVNAHRPSGLKAQACLGCLGARAVGKKAATVVQGRINKPPTA